MSATSKFYLLLVLLAAGVYVYYDWNDKQEGVERQQKSQAAQKDAVVTLLPGTEDAWVAYVDERLKRAFQPRDNSVLVESMFGQALGKSVFVSRNSPYTVECSPIEGGSVKFGTGEDATVVPVFGLLVMDALPKPALNVSSMSIASKNLNRLLCDRIQNAMTGIMTK